MTTENKKNTPPRWVDLLLKMVCAPELLEEILGDLHERHGIRTKRSGSHFRKQLSYLREACSYVRPRFMLRPTPHKTLHFAMINQHLKTSTRNIIRARVFSVINITGLALGITCFLAILLWVNAEKSIDNFHQNAEQLFSIYYTEKSAGNVHGGHAIPIEFIDINFDGSSVLANELKATFPEIKRATTYATSYELPWGHACTFRVGEKQQKFKGATAGPAFFQMFSFPLLAGDERTALSSRSGLAISRKMAESFFGSPTEAMGQTIRYENNNDFIITAVFEDITPLSTLQFDYLINWDLTHNDGILLSSGNIKTFVQLEKTADAIHFEDKVRDFLKARLNEYPELSVELGLQPFRDQYLRSNFVEGKPANGKIEYIRIFSGVAVFVLLVACINFTNLSTAQSVKKAREIGIRKVVGSSKFSLISQFLIESILMATVATILSVLLLFGIQSVLIELTNSAMMIPLGMPQFWIGLLLFSMIMGLIAGSLPALHISSVKPSAVLQGKNRLRGNSVWMQKALVVFQFGLSILLLISTVVISRQTGFIRNSHLGYDRENLISVRIEGELIQREKYLLLKSELEQAPGISLVDRSSEAPHNMGFEMASPFQWQGQDKNESVGFLPTSVGYDFLKIMDLKIVEGRDFDRRISGDSIAFMVNETALKQMNMSDPIGKWISAWGKRGPIIAVLKDYHTHSLRDPIKPLIVDVKEDLDFGLILVKTKPGETVQALSSMEQVFREINPNYPLSYTFIDDEYAALYDSETVINTLSNAFAALAIIISCLGLLGLAMFAAELRIKEMGIRKVLGASISSILHLFSRGFLQLIAIAFLIAAPISWWLMNNWLNGFAYRVELSWWIFLGTGIFISMMALMTIGIQAVKTALSDPIHALRSE